MSNTIVAASKRQVVHTLDRRLPSLAVRLRLIKYRLARAVEIRAIDRHVAAGDSVVDLGARRGLFTLALAKRVGAAGTVDAYEPFPDNFAALQQVFGGMPQVRLHQIAASDLPSRQTLVVPVEGGIPQTALGSLDAHAEKLDAVRVEVVCAPLDELLTHRPRRIGFIKCDIEGHELKAMMGARRILESDRPTVLMEIEQRHIQEPIQTRFQFMASLGYSSWCWPAGSRPLPIDAFDVLRDQNIDRPGRLGYVNMFVFLPR